MRILVTGGAGFIGSHLSEYLVGQGMKVICADNFSTGQKRNIQHFLDNKNFKVIYHDITRPLDRKLRKVDQIYNLASPASPVHYQRDPIQTIKTNVLGAINMLEIAKRFKIRILQASTSEIYGDPKEHPQKESYHGDVNILGPRACYDESKRCTETLFMDYWRKSQVDIRIVRIFNTYGPRMALNDGRVVSNFVVQALRGEDLTIYGDGNQTRSFCYIDDMVKGLVKMMGKDDFIGPVNLGNPNEIVIKELAAQILKLTGSASKIVYRILPQDDPRQRCPDISLAREKLNWQPETDLTEGFKKTIDYFKKLIHQIK